MLQMACTTLPSRGALEGGGGVSPCPRTRPYVAPIPCLCWEEVCAVGSRGLSFSVHSKGFEGQRLGSPPPRMMNPLHCKQSSGKSGSVRVQIPQADDHARQRPDSSRNISRFSRRSPASSRVYPHAFIDGCEEKSMAFGIMLTWV